MQRILPQHFKVQGYPGQSVKEKSEPGRRIADKQLFCESTESLVILKAIKIIVMVKNLRRFVECV